MSVSRVGTRENRYLPQSAHRRKDDRGKYKLQIAREVTRTDRRKCRNVRFDTARPCVINTARFPLRCAAVRKADFRRRKDAATGGTEDPRRVKRARKSARVNYNTHVRVCILHLRAGFGVISAQSRVLARDYIGMHPDAPASLSPASSLLAHPRHDIRVHLASRHSGGRVLPVWS